MIARAFGQIIRFTIHSLSVNILVPMLSVNILIHLQTADQVGQVYPERRSAASLFNVSRRWGCNGDRRGGGANDHRCEQPRFRGVERATRHAEVVLLRPVAGSVYRCRVTNFASRENKSIFDGHHVIERGLSVPPGIIGMMMSRGTDDALKLRAGDARTRLIIIWWPWLIRRRN